MCQNRQNRQNGGLQVSDVIGLCNTSTWSTMVSSIVLRCFNAFLRFSTFSECCTHIHSNCTSADFDSKSFKIRKLTFFPKITKNSQKLVFEFDLFAVSYYLNIWYLAIFVAFIQCLNAEQSIFYLTRWFMSR